jgi:hypothetical protein
MRRLTDITAILVLTVTLINGAGYALAAGAKGGGNQRGTPSSERKSGKDLGNSKSEWFADPERGWVRSNERRHSRENHGTVRNNGKQKDKGKGKRS